MKTVYLNFPQDIVPHNLWAMSVRHPPEGYRLVVETPALTAQRFPVNIFGSSKQVLFKLEKLQTHVYLREAWRVTKTLAYIFLKKSQGSHALLESHADLILSSQQLTFANVPWVVDFEFANALVNYGDIRLVRRFVQKALASKYCKKIMPWSNWAKRTLLRSLDCSSFEEKIETLHHGVMTKDFVKKKDSDKLRLLFVGSIHGLNYLNFELKGGIDVVDAFSELTKKYDRLELIVRSWVPPEVKEKCVKNPNIKLLYNPLSEEELSELYSSSDIFMFPSYLNLGLVLLEAMSYELPVIAPRIFDVPEAVEDMKTGILVDTPPKLRFYSWNGEGNWSLPLIRKYRPWRVEKIVEKTSLLIENDSLRRKIGQEARRLVEYGEFSFKHRNEKLKRIFDEATD